jgi:DNA-binding NarL/FixJ family response regulator
VKYRIFLADDHALVREGLKMILAKRPDFEVVGEAGDGFELLSLLKQGPAPDAIVLDISMPKLRGIEAIHEIKDLDLKVKVLVLTMHKDEDFLCQAFIAGADGYLLKEDVAKELFAALDSIFRGDIYISSLLGEEMKGAWLKIIRERKNVRSSEMLSSREKQVLKLIAEGRSNKVIADLLCISTRTVDHHRARIIKKLNLKGTAELIRYAIAKGYVL